MRGLLLFVATLACIAVAIDRTTSEALPEELHPWAGLLAALLITLGLSNFWSLARGYGRGDNSRRALLDRARAGLPPQDDGPILATGVVRADGFPLVSPVSGQPCVAYQYRIYERYLVANANWETRVWYWGYACRRFRLETPSLSLPVLSMPCFVESPSRYEDEPEASARTEAYIAATAFETGTMPLSIDGVSHLAGALLTSEHQEVRRDWRRDGAPPTMEGLRIEEQVLPAGGTASFWGVWSSRQQAIVPGTLGSGSPGIATVIGPPERLLGSVTGPPSSVTAVALTAVVLLGMGGALVWAAQAGHVTRCWIWMTS